MRRYILLVLFIISCSVHAGAQKISGYVKDAVTRETLAGASVVCSSGTAISSNGYGYYMISGKPGDVVTVSYLGYDSQSIALDIPGDAIINIMLEPSETPIEEVTVSGRNNPVVFGEGGKVSVNMNQLKFVPLFLGEQDVLKYLQTLPGVTPGKEGSTALNIRGGSADQSLILLDDVPLYNMAHTFGFLSIVSGNMVKSADFYKGYIPAQYGGRLSGVVSMRTKDGNRNEHRQSITVGTISAGFSLEGPIIKDKASYMLSARRFTPDLLFLRAYNKIKDPEERVMYSFYDIAGKVTFDLGERNALHASFYTGRDRTSAESDQMLDDEKYVVGGGAFIWGNMMAALKLNTAIRPDMFMNNTVYYSRQRNAKRAYQQIEGLSADYKSEVWSVMNEFGIISSTQNHVSSLYDITYGLSGSYRMFDPNNITTEYNGKVSERSYNNQKLYTASVFADNRLKWKNHKLTLGLRGSYYNNSREGVFAFEPGTSFTTALSGNTSLWASFTMSSQAIMSADLMYFSLPLNFWTPFQDKKIQHSRQYSAGMKTLIAGAIDVTAEVYYKSMQNVALVYDSDSYITGQGGVDYSKGRAYGIELNAQYGKERYGINMSYAYSRSFRIVDGRRYLFEYDTPHVLNVFAHYNTVRCGDRLHTISVNANYKTGIPYIYTDEVYNMGIMFGGYTGYYSVIGVNYPKYPNTRLSDYFRVDLSYNMDRKRKNGVRSWQISVLNVFNRKNIYLIYSKLDSETNKLSYKKLVLIPIMPSVSYSRTF